MQLTPQIIQLQPHQMANTVAPPPGGIQIVQQIIGPNGEIQQIPIQLTSQQLQLIRAQMTGSSTYLAIFVNFEILCLILSLLYRHAPSTPSYPNGANSSDIIATISTTTACTDPTTKWPTRPYCLRSDGFYNLHIFHERIN
jgi:hypothetical protein